MASHSDDTITANDAAPTVFEIDYEFTWNTGRQPQYWYRILGTMPDETQFATNPSDPCVPNGCCQKIMMNIHADSLDDLCKRLRQAGWKYTIDSVTRLAVPAETAAAEALIAQGLDPRCLLAEEVNLCDIPVCAEFCIDHDIEECWCWDDNQSVEAASRVLALSITSIRYVQAAADLALGSVTKTRLYREGEVHRHVMRGSLVTSGASSHRADFRTERLPVGLVLGSRTRLKSDHLRFRMSEYPRRTEAIQLRPFESRPVTGAERSWVVGETVLVDLGLGATSERLAYRLSERGGRPVGYSLTLRRSAVGLVRENGVFVTVGGRPLGPNMARRDVTWPVGLPSPASYSYLGDPVDKGDIEVGVEVQGVTRSPKLGATLHDASLVLYYESGDPRIRMGSCAKIRSEVYRHSMNGGPIVGGGFGLRTEWKHIFVGGLSIGGGNRKSYRASFGSGLVLGSASKSLSTGYRHGRVGALTLGSSTTLKAPIVRMSMSGLLTLGGGTNPVLAHECSAMAGLLVGSVTKTRVSFNTRLGALVLGLVGAVKSEYFRRAAGGGLVLGGSANARAGSHGTVLMALAQKPSSRALDVQVHFPVAREVQTLKAVQDASAAATVAPTITSPTRTIAACLCSGLPASLPMAQNVGIQNKLSEFAQRNNFTLPTTINLQHTAYDHCWQSTTHYQGFSSVTNARETWGIVYDLQCTSTVGGSEIDQSIWKFGMRVSQKSLSTGQHLETRVVVGFLPDQVCLKGQIFKVQMDIDVVQSTVLITPTSTLYQFVLYDSLGLFKTAYWLGSPLLSFSISQPGLTVNPTRLALDLGVHS